MSFELKRTMLNGILPHPVAVLPLNAVLSEFEGWSGVFLEDICKVLPGYTGQDRPKTDDDYVWFWGVNFTCPSGTVRILLPWAQDWDRKDGSRLDRSAAVYADPAVSEADVFNIVFRLTGALMTAWVKRKRDAAKAIVVP